MNNFDSSLRKYPNIDKINTRLDVLHIKYTIQKLLL